jgi:di/tripeptidase
MVADHFDVAKFAANGGIPLTAGQIGELEFENFNACRS